MFIWHRFATTTRSALVQEDIWDFEVKVARLGDEAQAKASEYNAYAALFAEL